MNRRARLDGLRDPAEEWIPGTVTLTDWYQVPWERGACRGVFGDVRVVNSEAAVGFTIVGDRQANWVALVRGPTDTIHVVPGCKVAAITYGAAPASSDFARVP